MASPKKKNIPIAKTNGSKFWIRLLLAFSAFILYSNTLDHGFTLDDDIYFLKHTSVQKGVKGIGETFTNGSMTKFDGSKGLQPYRPISLTISAIQKEMTGNIPAAAHFFNVLLYILLGIIIHVFLCRLFPDFNPWVNALITLFFLVHPVHTEVVANIKSRDEILAAIFGILALIQCLKITGKSFDFRTGILSGFFFMLALFSKENAIAFLAIVPVMLIILRNEKIGPVVIKTVPFIIAAAFFLFIRNEVIGQSINLYQQTVVENVLYGVKNASELWATKIEILFMSIKLLFIPFPLTWDYSFRQIPVVSFSSPIVILSIATYLVLAGMIILCMKKNPIISFSILFYLVMLVPTSNLFFITGSAFAERFLFIPSLGFSIALIYGGMKIFKIDSSKFQGVKRNVFLGIFTAIIILFSGMTIARNKDWKSNITIFESGVQGSPNSTRAHTALASEYRTMAEREPNGAKRNEYLKMAIQSFDVALSILPSNTYASYNLGVTYSMMGLNGDAEKAFRQTLVSDSLHPFALNNMAVAFSGKQMYDSALVYLRKLVRVNPENMLAVQNISAICFLKNDLDQSIIYGNQAIKLDSTSAKSYQILSEAYRLKNQPEESARYLELFNRYNH